MQRNASHPYLCFDFRDSHGKRRPLCFSDPQEILVARRLDEVVPALQAVQEGVGRGLYAAGYLAYEAAPALDPALRAHRNAPLPLLWFGLFGAPQPLALPASEAAFDLSAWQPSLSVEEYRRGVDRIRAAIARGETYQVNYTLRLRSRFAGDDRAFYRRLCAAQRGDYCAYLNLGRHRILSASPELFFCWQGDTLRTRPMKGTAPRGRWLEEDAAQATWLHASEKNRAENVMIVDLLRSDLGRIARTGTVEVPRLFEVESYPTIQQMTSTVTARTRPGTTLLDVFRALFPCGSVTGAPKVSTMGLIADLEDSPRGAYCGSIGWIAPDGEAVFNVAIRTVVIDTHRKTAEYGVGGGITWASTSADEYTEARIKAAVLTEEWPRFDLLETLRLEKGRYMLLERHLQRLVSSAAYFDIPLSIGTVRAALEAEASAFPEGTWRVRLRISQEGEARIERAPLTPLAAPLRVALAGEPVCRQDRFLFHKTTHRAVYDRLRSAHNDIFDVLLWNEQGELTEFTIGNLVAEIDGQRWTPCRDSGLLAGTFRAELLERGEIQERVLTRADLASASRLWLINSVRGWVPVRLQPS